MEQQRPAITVIDLAVITAICFGLFVLVSIDSVMDGIATYNVTNDELGATIVTEMGMAAFALGYLRIRGHHLRHLLPAPTLHGTLTGGGLYALVVVLFAAVQSFLALGLPALREASSVVQVDASALMIVAMSLVNGLYEEFFLLGVLQAALARSERHFAVGIVLLLRVSYHLYQGLEGTAFAVVFGAVLGYYYLRTGKLWPAVAAHVVADILALW
jgi:membrane protease YdiL (CAAX protease family)